VNTRVGDQRYHHCMSSDMRPGAFPPDPGQKWGPPPPAASALSAQTPLAPPMAFGRPARWPWFTALAIALAALAVSLVGWFRPAAHNNQPPPKPTYTDQQVADAKANVCTAFGKLERAVDVVNAVPNGTDANEQLAAATSTRQVFDVFSRYLLAKLAQEPATPPDLATAVRKEASSLQEGVIGYLDGLTNSDPQMRPLVEANTEAAKTIRRLCK
jgi:hypothetical protein